MVIKFYLLMKVKQFVAKTSNIFPAISKWCFSIVLNRRIKVVKKYLEESDYAFLFFTDSHWGVNEKHFPKMIKEITRRLGIKNVFFGGDIVTHFDSSKEKTEELFNDFINSFKSSDYSFFPILGNHDLNSFDQSNKSAIFSISEIEFLYKDFYSKSVESFESFNFYVDDDANRVRFICLNTIDKEYIDENQKDYLAQALYSTKESYKIIVLSHIWVEWSIERNCYYSNEKINELLDIFDAYNLRKKYGIYDFSECFSKIILIVGGHIHNNFLTNTKSGIPILLCDCDCINLTYSESRIVCNLPNDQSIHAIIISTIKREINVVNIGRGKERHLSFED